MKLICYLSNGYRTFGETLRLAKIYFDAGCDILELDIPSKNPYLEGEYIKNRMLEALRNCDDYDKYFNAFIEIKKQNPNKKIIVLSYENTVKEIGKEVFADFCVNNNFLDVIYVGLEDEKIKDYLLSRGIKISCYVRFCMDEKEIESAEKSNGFVYMQAKPIGVEINPKFKTLKDCIAELRRRGIDREIYCGVGVAATDDYKMVLNSNGDGVFVGSSVLKLYDNEKGLKKTIEEFKKI